ncbi:MAG: hypothetical protein ACP5O1_11945 [Phycisphaerae bacterium]
MESRNHNHYASSCVALLAAAAVLAVAFLAALGMHSAPALPQAPAGALGKEGLTRYLYTQAKRRDGFDWTMEDILPARPHGAYRGIGDPRVVPPPPGAPVRQVVRILRPQLPNMRVWQDAVDRDVVHFALKRLLAWKGYPLGLKVTAMGRMSIRQLMARVVAKVAQHIQLQSGILSGSGVGLIGSVYVRQAPLNFPLQIHQRNVTIRRLLTAGWPYATHGNGHWHGELWGAWAYQHGRDGRFKRTMDIILNFPPSAWSERQGTTNKK